MARKKATNEVDEIVDKLREDQKPKKISPIDYSKGLSTGSTLLNLACAGKPLVGFLPGKYYYLVGDSSSGKSFLSLTCMAEATLNQHFEKYRLIYDNSEDGALMSIENFFGKSLADRIEPPRWIQGSPVYSSTIEEFYYHIDDAFDAKVPFIYILDSMDSLSSEDEESKFQEKKAASRKNSSKEVKGSYGDGKAKKNSTGMRRVIHNLEKSGSILLVISQTRDDIKPGSFQEKTRAGGHALRFYATLEMWSSVAKKLTKTVNDIERQTGIICRIRIKKNRMTGKERVIEIPIYHSFGFDDISSCVDYLIREKHWKGGEGKFSAPEFDVTGSKEKIIRTIEAGDHELELRSLVCDVWDGIEEACRIDRKKRY